MNKERLQAYEQLIQNLLECPSGEEPQILGANKNLVDADLVQVMLQMASHLINQSELNQANRLMNVAGYILGVYGNSLSTATQQQYLNFLLQILQATSNSNGDPQVIYPLLAANTDKLDDIFAELLRRWATNILAEAEPETAAYTATVIFKLSNLIQQFPKGSKANNIEIAITGYKIALTVRTQSAFGVEWAMTQNNLGLAYSKRILGEKAENIENAIAAYTQALTIYTQSGFGVKWAGTQNNLGLAYSNRILGDKAENIENAIAAFTQALTVYTQSAFPFDWAATQNNLGAAYSERILGNKAENIENAIAAYTQALTVRTQSAFGVDWAGTQNNLGAAYRNRILGNKAENIEIAITAFTQALKVYTQSAFPFEWARTQNNLGNAYGDRILGDKAENIELAITAYTQALKVYTQSAFPFEWATTKNNLGNAYRNRILGNKADNIEIAIAAFKNTLDVYTQSAFPFEWARTQNNLGNAYRNIILGNKAENIENAIEAYTQALKVYTQSAFPVQWAKTQNNLGNAYCQRILGNKADNIQIAIAAYNQALSIRTRSAFPVDWAGTQNNLGLAYRDKIIGERAENIENAIAAFSAALEVYTKSAFPQNYAGTLLNLGILYQDEKQFHSAYNTFAQGIETMEALRGEIVSGAEANRKQAEEWNKLYLRIVEVCLALGRKTEAIEYIERSKTRNLVELILNRDLKSIFPPEVVTQLEQLRDEIASGQYELQNGKAENPTVLAQHLQQLRQQRQKLQDEYLPVGSGFKFEQFQKTLDEHTAIIEWYIASDKILAFVIKPHGQELTFWQSQPEDLDALINWTDEYLDDYYNTEDQDKVQWQNQLEERLQKLAEILHLEEILAQVPKECDRLILIPHLYLHLLPLHALPVRESYLIDLFPKGVSYAPSCQLLQQVQRRQRPDFKSLFAIQNPTEDLNYADLEVESILPLFSSPEVLSNSKATKAALTQATPQLTEVNCLHFSCHGSFVPNSPLDSYLQLANTYVSHIPANADRKRYVKLLNKKIVDLNKCLTLGNLFERDFDLNQCRLVVLSACETGLIDATNTSDEYIGLPSVFLYAGSVGVVNSLWTVNDLSTAFLMIKFFQNFQVPLTANQDMSVASALKEAQCWLRNASKEELQEWAKTLPLDGAKKGIIRRQLRRKTEEKPFKYPYHWAALTAVGK